MAPRSSPQSHDDADPTYAQNRSSGASRFRSSASTHAPKSRWLAFQGDDSDSDSDSGSGSDSASASDSESASSSSIDATSDDENKVVDDDFSFSDEDSDDGDGGEDDGFGGRVSDATLARARAGAATSASASASASAKKPVKSSYFDDDFDLSSDDGSDDSLPKVEDPGKEEMDPEKRRLKWLKVVPTTDSTSATAAKKPSEQTAQRMRKQRTVVASSEAEDPASIATQRSADEKQAKTAQAVRTMLGGTEVAPEKIIPKLNELMMIRGRKTTDRDAVAAALGILLDQAPYVYQRIKILFSTVIFYFDLAQANVQFLPVVPWRLALAKLYELFELLDENTQITVSENYAEEAEKSTEEDTNEESKLFKDVEKDLEAAATLRMTVSTYAVRLDEEFLKSLAVLNPQASEYAERIRDYCPLYMLLLRAEAYFRRTLQHESACRVLSCRVEHLYPRHSAINERFESQVYRRLPAKVAELTRMPLSRLIRDLCDCKSVRIRTRALICDVHRLAIEDKYHAARDKLLMSLLPTTIFSADTSTQAMYNRAIAHLALCAFRRGLMVEAHAGLHELLNKDAARALLNHGHNTVDTDLLDSVYWTAGMLLDVPLIAAGEPESPQLRSYQRSFRRIYDSSERAPFQGPPESTRDQLVTAARLILQGDWHAAERHVCNVRAWTTLVAPNSTAALCAMLKDRVQETALMSWLLRAQASSSFIDLKHLADQFDVSLSRVSAIAVRLITSGHLSAKLDGVYDMLHVTRPTSRLEALSAAAAAKLMVIIDAHENIPDDPATAAAAAAAAASSAATSGSSAFSGFGGAGFGSYIPAAGLRNGKKTGDRKEPRQRGTRVA